MGWGEGVGVGVRSQSRSFPEVSPPLPSVGFQSWPLNAREEFKAGEGGFADDRCPGAGVSWAGALGHPPPTLLLSLAACSRLGARLNLPSRRHQSWSASPAVGGYWK